MSDLLDTASFAGHAPESPWSTLQLAYFAGYAMWTYLTQPFTFTTPGIVTNELEPWAQWPCGLSTSDRLT